MPKSDIFPYSYAPETSYVDQLLVSYSRAEFTAYHLFHD